MMQNTRIRTSNIAKIASRSLDNCKKDVRTRLRKSIRSMESLGNHLVVVGTEPHGAARCPWSEAMTTKL